MSLVRHIGLPLAATLVLGALTRPRSPAHAADRPADADWKAGVATVTITPDGPIRMAGYAGRTRPSEGVAQDLLAKALALEDAAGNRLVVVTMDLIGIPRTVRDAVAREVEAKHRLPPASLILNASHTHTGPVVRSGGSVAYDLSPGEGEAVDRYVAALHRKLVDVIGRALADLKPATLGYSHARCGVAMNRRLPTAKGVRLAANPDGPVDLDVPVLRVAGADGKPRAVLFGYACHNTTLTQNDYRICGDYAGFAQRDLEAAHPGAVALFLAGCGGDQNPYPRGTLALAEQHGRAVANAVEAALEPPPKPVRGPLKVVSGEVTLEFAPLGRDELLRLKESANAQDRRRAKLLLDELEQKGRPDATYPYPIQSVQFGSDLTLVALAGEVVVDYGLRLKRELAGAGPVWVAAYCNDVFGYVPTVRVLREGGYEPVDSLRFTRFPGPFAPSVEERIVGKVHDLVRRVRGGPGE